MQEIAVAHLQLKSLTRFKHIHKKHLDCKIDQAELPAFLINTSEQKSAQILLSTVKIKLFFKMIFATLSSSLNKYLSQSTPILYDCSF